MANVKRKRLEANQLKAISLLVSKDVNGMTNEEIAEEVGVNPSTLYRWRKDSRFNDELIAQAEEIQRTFLADTYSSLRSIIANKSAKDGTKLKAIELMLKNQGRLKEVHDTSVTVEERSVSDMLKELENM